MLKVEQFRKDADTYLQNTHPALYRGLMKSDLGPVILAVMAKFAVACIERDRRVEESVAGDAA